MAPSASKIKQANPGSPTTPGATAGRNTKKATGGSSISSPFFMAASFAILVGASCMYSYLNGSPSSQQHGGGYRPSATLSEFFTESKFLHVGDTISITYPPKDAATERDSPHGSAADGTHPSDASLDLRYPFVTVTKKGNAPVAARTEPLFSVPIDLVIDPNTIRKSPASALMTYDQGAHLKDLGDRSFQQIFFYSFYLMYERRRGKESPLYKWFSTLPDSFEHLGGALYWPDEVADCLDRLAHAEFVAIKSIVGMTAQAANVCCELPEDAIAGATVCESIVKKETEPFDDEEARWAISVYLRYNYLDQAIVPGMNVFRRSNEAEGVLLQPSTDKSKEIDGKPGYVDVVSGRPLKADEEPVWNYARGPGSALVSFGIFDNRTSVVELPFRLPDAKPGSLIYKACHEQYHQLHFLQNGKPKEQIIQCFGALLAQTKEQKKNINNLRTREPMLLLDVYGNLTLVAHRHSMSIINATQPESQCSLEGVTNETHRETILAYISFSNQFFNRVTSHLFNETERLAVAAGVPSRLRQDNSDGDENEGEGEDGN